MSLTGNPGDTATQTRRFEGGRRSGKPDWSGPPFQALLADMQMPEATMKRLELIYAAELARLSYVGASVLPAGLLRFGIPRFRCL